VFVLTATDGSYVETTAPTSYDQVASGSWEMYGVVYNAADGDLELSGIDTTFDISTASFVDSFSVGGQDAAPSGIAFNTDGTKMFISGVVNAAVFEYTLSTGFDVSTASYVDSFSVSAQETSPWGLAFSTDGTKMFITGSSGDDVNEYTLSTAFDVSTSSFVDTFSVSAQETTPRGLTFNSTGTKMFVVGPTSDSVHTYNLISGFDVSTASFVESFSVSGQDSSPVGIAFNNSGVKMFILGNNGQDVNYYNLSIGFDVSTASFVESFSVASQDGNPLGIAFNNNGTKMFISGSDGDDINEYSLTGVSYFTTGYQPVHTTSSIDSTYWTDINSMTADQAAGEGNVYYAISTDDRTTWTVIDNTDGERDIVRNNAGTWQYNSNGTYASETWVNGATNTELATLAEAMEGAVDGNYNVSSLSYDSVSFSANSQESFTQAIVFKDDGTKLYVTGSASDTVYQYTLTTAFDLSTASYDSVSFSVSAQDTFPRGLAFSSDGSKMYMAGITNDSVYQYSLSTNWDLSTASYDSVSFSVSGQDLTLGELKFNSIGTKMYIIGDTNDSVFQYTLSSAWDLSTASYDSVSFSVASQENTPTALLFSADGSKMFICGNQNNTIYQYSLSVAYDISTSSYDSVSFNTTGTSLAFNSNGSKLYVASLNGVIYQYTVGGIIYPNQMDKTQLDAVTDPNHIALGNDLDLSIIFNMTSGTTVPSSDGVAINYDANVLNKGAVLGTDYDFDAPAGNAVRVTALAANNLKVRVV
jgi:sugar lactone lactonase YvrE